jgi:hypothetical protein
MERIGNDFPISFGGSEHSTSGLVVRPIEFSVMPFTADHPMLTFGCSVHVRLDSVMEYRNTDEGENGDAQFTPIVVRFHLV